MTTSVSVQEIRQGLENSPQWVERALVVLDQKGLFGDLQDHALQDLSAKLQQGDKLTADEMDHARSRLQQATYVNKLVELAVAKRSRAGSVPPVPQKARPRRYVASLEEINTHMQDVHAQREMWLFLESFPPTWKEHDIVAWTQCLRPGRGGMPAPSLRSKLIRTALEAGWKPGATHMDDADRDILFPEG